MNNKLLNHLNIHYKSNEIDAKTTCLWCGKSALSVKNEQPFEFQCFSCKQTGNGYTIIRQFYLTIPDITKDQATKLSNKKKGIKPITLKNLGVKHTNNTYFIPVLNQASALVALHKYTLNSPSVIASPKPLALSILGLQNLYDKCSTIMICEGHWDYMIMKQLDLEEHICILGTAGSYFTQSYLHYLRNRDIIILFDNDDAGKDGVEHIARNLKIQNITVTSLQHLDWSKVKVSGLDIIPNKFDIRDLFNTVS